MAEPEERSNAIPQHEGWLYVQGASVRYTDMDTTIETLLSLNSRDHHSRLRLSIPNFLTPSVFHLLAFFLNMSVIPGDGSGCILHYTVLSLPCAGTGVGTMLLVPTFSSRAAL
jgi:hypothetical protein